MTTLTKKQKEKAEENGWDIDAVKAYVELGIGNDDLDDFEEAYQGKHESDEVFVRDLLMETGDIPEDLPFYIYIDWELTTRDVMMDYSEQNRYYFRNL